MANLVHETVSRHKQGEPVGVYSVCSAHPMVIRAAMGEALDRKTFLLVESTSNQVTQFGGYTGMTPADFRKFVLKQAEETGFSPEMLVLGGDHLGPNPWQDEPGEQAMEKSRELIRAYVEAGFTKIHLDTSMRCADDEGDAHTPMDDTVVGKRAADLCRTAEDAASKRPAGTPEPVYIIGTEVPIPGGAQEGLEHLTVTSKDHASRTIEAFKKAFYDRGLKEAWKRVVGTVVQPGVEFGDTEIREYRRDEARSLSAFIESDPLLVYEAHSTDYQRGKMLRRMVEDHFAILKVGPWLTFALREALFALARIEEEWLGNRDVRLSRLIDTAENVMTAAPEHWVKHYHGTEEEKAFKRKYSYSDRIRYYWPRNELTSAVDTLMSNLTDYPAPLSLLSQYLPEQYHAVREGAIEPLPADIIDHKVRGVCRLYHDAARQNNHT